MLVTRGALAAEALVLRRMAELAAEARRDPGLLALPVRVIVPSRSLRAHLSAALVRARQRSLAGVRVQTLHGLAFEILERAGETAPRGQPLLEILAQRFAEKEPLLRAGLGDLVDGYGGVSATVRDLLDAGLEPVHAEPALEILSLDGPFVAGRAKIERARALVRVAARTDEEMSQRGLGSHSTLLRRAAELLEADAERVLPSRTVLVHGFADATGVAADLLQSLLRRRSACLVLDRPPAWQGEGVESAFTERLVSRLSPVAAVEEAEPPPLEAVPPPRVERFQAPGAGSEAREVARRIRGLLDSGARPEGIGIVARDLSPCRLSLALHLRRLGVPFSAFSTRGALGPAGRRARAFLELLRRSEDVPAERWLDAVAIIAEVSSSVGMMDLRLAFASLGAGRLRDVTALRPDLFLGKESDSYPLPIRHGLKEATREGEEADPEEHREIFAVRRQVKGERIRAAVKLAVRTRERLAGWPEQAAAEEHLARLRTLLTQDLGWREADEAGRPVFEALEALGRELPPRFALDRDELRRLLARELEEAGTAELGGAGGGVQVLSAMEARGRTFEHLFLIGLNRDAFPRGIREDPLLPDDLRRVLQRVLPDLPVKLAGFDEERWLFSHLLSASPSVTLSWQSVDEDGKVLSASPLLRDVGGVDKIPPFWSRESVLLGPRTSAERAVLAALHGPRRGLAPLLGVARLAVLDELDPDLRTPEGRAARARLGPYFGFLGPLTGLEKDPRRRDLYVTHLEALAACPWQLFLRRLLRLEPTPDPLEMAPGADPLLLGNLTHKVLERIVNEAGVGRNGEPVSVDWPPEHDLQAWLLDESVRLLAEEGIFLPGLAKALAEQVRTRLEAAREADWSEGPVPVLRAEDEGSLTVWDAEGRARSIHFRADRLDLLDGGALRRTDYKTGKPISDKRGEQTRRRHFLERVRAGTHLQGVAYRLAGGAEALGRYLFLKPGLESREFEAGPEDRDLEEAFAGSVQAVLAAWDAGAFFPRLVDPAGREEPLRCRSCEVSEACLRGDSGARLRLFEWADRLAAEEEFSSAEKALLRVWSLAGKPRNEEGTE